MNTFDPVIKWTGSKRTQADKIIKYFPKQINTYYEPFCGGASVLFGLLHSDISVNNYICSDINSDLINLWNVLINNPKSVINHYRKLWKELNKDSDIDRKREYFESIRDRYNKEHNPLDFMFIMRTTTNGMPRYNKDGEFNNSFHLTRCGIKPNEFEKIINYWSGILKNKKVKFINCSYTDILPAPTLNDFVYLDPPYVNTKGMYYGTIDYDEFFNYLRNLTCSYAFSFDGIAGKENNTFDVPKDVYTNHEYLYNGNSSFRRTIGKSNNVDVLESLYINNKRS